MPSTPTAPGIYMLPRRRKNQIENSGIISEQKQETPLPACPDHFGRGSGVGLLAPEKIQIEKSGIKTEQNTFTHSFPACPDHFGVLRELRNNHDNNTEDINNVVTSGTKAVSDGRVDEGSTQADPQPDPLAASFYKQDQHTLESAPPPHILTPKM